MMGNGPGLSLRLQSLIIIKENMIFDGGAMIDEAQESKNFLIKPDEIIFYEGGEKKDKFLLKKDPYCMWIEMTAQGIQIRKKAKEEPSFTDYQLYKLIEYEEVKNFKSFFKLEKNQNQKEIIFIFGEDNGQEKQGEDNLKALILVLAFYNPKESRGVCDYIKEKVKEQTQAINSLMQFHYLGIEENIRKVMEKVLMENKSKRDLYTKIIQKTKQKKMQLSLEQLKLMLKALVGNEKAMKSIMMKEKVQAYTIEKNRYGLMIEKQTGGPNTLQIDEQEMEYELEGYSEKRKMDGAIPLYKEQIKDQMLNYDFEKKFSEEIYIDKIPEREQYEIDNILHPDQFQSQNQTEKKAFHRLWLNVEEDKREQPCRVDPSKKVLYSGKVKVPEKRYDIFSKASIKFGGGDKGRALDNENDLKIGVEGTKFFYQLMKINDEHRKPYEEGPLTPVMEALRDILVSLRKRAKPDSGMALMLDKVSSNYLTYRKEMHK